MTFSFRHFGNQGLKVPSSILCMLIFFSSSFISFCRSAQAISSFKTIVKVTNMSLHIYLSYLWNLGGPCCYTGHNIASPSPAPGTIPLSKFPRSGFLHLSPSSPAESYLANRNPPRMSNTSLMSYGSTFRSRSGSGSRPRGRQNVRVQWWGMS